MENIITREHPLARLTDFSFFIFFDLSKPFYFTLEYELPDYLQSAGPLRILEMPSMEIGFGETGLKEREFPVEYYSSSQSKRVYRVKMPRGLRLKFMPSDIVLKNPIADYSLTFRREGDRELVVVSDFKRKGRVVEPRHWSRYRDFMMAVATASQTKLFFEVAK